MEPIAVHAVGAAEVDTLETASLILCGYLRRLASAAGVTWDQASEDEVRLALGCLVDAARVG
jgi:hypothetical protein